MQKRNRILIIGCGGIGGVIATKLHAKHAADIAVVSTNQSICSAVRKHGFRLSGLDGHGCEKGSIHETIPTGEFDFVLLATRPPQVEDAAQQASAVLSKTGAMVVLQNGLCETRVANIVGIDRTIGGIVSFGASMPQPGEFELTARGGITLGSIHDDAHSHLDELVQLLAPVGPIKTTQNLIGARYSKLALNCAVSAMGTVAGVALGDMLRNTTARNVALRVMREVVQVSRAEGVKIEPIAGTFDLNWLANPHSKNSGPNHWVRHLMLLLVGLKYRRLRSSMLRAIERGRSPAVAFLNGEIVQRGAAHQIHTPYNQALLDMVLRIASGKAQSNMKHIEDIQASIDKTA